MVVLGTYFLICSPCLCLGRCWNIVLGSKRFLNLYFICGIGAIVIQMLVQAIQVHAITGGIHYIASRIGVTLICIMAQTPKNYLIFIIRQLLVHQGLFLAYWLLLAMLYPNLEMMILFIPVPIKAKYIIPVYIVIELWLGIGQYGGDNVAHFAHLGGALFGFIMVKFWRLQRPNNYF